MGDVINYNQIHTRIYCGRTYIAYTKIYMYQYIFQFLNVYILFNYVQTKKERERERDRQTEGVAKTLSQWVDDLSIFMNGPLLSFTIHSYSV